MGIPLPGKDHVMGLAVWRDITGGGLADPLSASGGSHIARYESLQELEDAGVDSTTTDYKDVHYHVKEFFRQNPQGVLWLGVFDSTTPNGGSPAYTELETMQTQAGGEIRGFGVYAVSAGSAATSLTFATAELNDIQSVLDTLASNHQPCFAIAAHDHSGISSGDMDTLTDLTGLSSAAPRVGAVISQDGANTGANLFSSLGYSITDLGSKLGIASAAAVNESIAWVGAFNVTDGSELDVPAFANGDKNTVYSPATLDTINDNHYLFLRKFTGLQGTYNSDSWTAAPKTNDFSTIENNRTMDKAVRGIRANVLPNTSGPIRTNTDGTLTRDFLDKIENDALQRPRQMARDEEIASNDEGKLPDGTVVIDPTQDVVSTSEVKLKVELVPVGVARTITTIVGFTTSI